jgi:photosystem II stability/assembly factor-like uncharacterized protein
MKSGFKIVFLISIIIGFSCKKSTIEYGPEFPFEKVHESIVDMGNWEISKISYKFSLESRDIYFINNDTGFIVGNEGRIFRTTDSGKTWRRMESGTALNLVSVYFINDRVGYASGEGLNCPWHNCSKGSFLFKTTDCGETWTKLLFPEYYRILSLKFFDESHAVAIIFTEGQLDSLKANVATSSDGGTIWKMADLDLKPGVERLFFSDDLIFIQGRRQQLYKSSDHGVTWDTINAPVIQNNSIRYFYFINEKIGFADVMTGVYKTKDGGSTWSEVQLPFPYPDPLYFYNENEGFRLKGAYIFINETKYPTREGSNFYLTNDGGITWTQGMLNELVAMDQTHFPFPGSGFGVRLSDFYEYTRKSD